MKTALGCTIFFKVQKEFSWLLPILVPVTFTTNSYVIYFFGTYILQLLFTFEIVLFVWKLVRFFSSLFSFCSKRFQSLFSCLTKLFEKFIVKFLISSFEYSPPRCSSYVEFQNFDFPLFIHIKHLKLKNC